MSDSNESTADAITSTVLELLKTPDDPALAEAQALLARRIATSSALSAARIPPPQNITEVGGYLNLLEAAGEDTLRLQAVAGALGLAGPMDTPFRPGGPDIGFASIDGLRITSQAQAAAPPTIEVRADFSGPLETVLTRVRGLGLELPLLSTRSPLPAYDQPITDQDALMELIGRRLRIAPSTALIDPTTDGVLVANGASGIEVHLRRVDDGAAQAADVAEVTLDTFICSDTECSPLSLTSHAEPLAPLLAVAGWFPGPRSAPQTLSTPGAWDSFYNATGLVVGETTYGDELSRIFTGPQIAASGARHRLGAVWNGTEFA
ncbi:MAG: hypothetical protein AAFX94_06225 [Myxococcota bacterium]